MNLHMFFTEILLIAHIIMSADLSYWTTPEHIHVYYMPKTKVLFATYMLKVWLQSAVLFCF